MPLSLSHEQKEEGASLMAASSLILGHYWGFWWPRRHEYKLEDKFSLNRSQFWPFFTAELGNHVWKLRAQQIKVSTPFQCHHWGLYWPCAVNPNFGRWPWKSFSIVFQLAWWTWLNPWGDQLCAFFFLIISVGSFFKLPLEVWTTFMLIFISSMFEYCPTSSSYVFILVHATHSMDVIHISRFGIRSCLWTT